MLLVKLLKNVFSGKFGAKIWAVGWIEPFLFGHKRVIAWSEFFFFFGANGRRLLQRRTCDVIFFGGEAVKHFSPNIKTTKPKRLILISHQ